jgi:hypothetical protein
MRSLGWVLMLLGCFLSRVDARPVHGVVFDDRNGNGARDESEPGIAAVGVSDGSAIAVSDADGRYEFAAQDGAMIFVIKPRDWKPPVNPNGLPQYYRSSAVEGAMDFPLRRSVEPDHFRVLVLTDPQPVSTKEIGYFKRTIIDALEETKEYNFSVMLGDVVYDRHELYSPLAAALARIRIPMYSVNGNHDLDLGAADDRKATASFERMYGPSTFAFHYSRALFVGLNNVRYLGGPRFIGGLREDQFTFLENLLKLTPKDEAIILMMHIPWFYPNAMKPETFRIADRARLYAMLQDRPDVLWLSGHTHYQRHVFHDVADGWKGAQPLHEFNVGAASGSYWGGPPDARGLPLSTMSDGTPQGYGTLEVTPTTMKTQYRAARHPAEFQIGLHAPTAVKPRSSFVSYYANVFNGHEGWTIESRVDQRAWNQMRRTIDWDPAYATLFLAQDALAVPLATPRLPDPTLCYHLWKSALPADLSPGVHVIEVRATDPYGAVFTSSREVRVVEPRAD